MELLTTRMKTIYCYVLHLASSPNLTNSFVCTSGTDRTNVCWVKEGCSSLKPKACSSLPLDVVDHVDREFDAKKLNFHLNTGCYTGDKLQAQLDNAPASCNPPCFRITKPGEYCYMSTRNNNFSNQRHRDRLQSPMPHYLRNKTLIYYCSLNAHGFEYLFVVNVLITTKRCPICCLELSYKSCI